MKIIKILLGIIALLATTDVSVAQSGVLNETGKISEMMTFYEQKNREVDEIQGWRIQVLATTDRRLMEQTKSRFSREFPQLRSRWTHKEPYYQIKAGAFATKIEALPYLEKVKKKFHKAHLVVDDVPYDEILN